MASKHDVQLDQVFVLPHVATDVIDSAQKAIDDLKWEDDFDSSANDLDDDFDDNDGLSTPAYSMLTGRSANRYSHSNSFTGSRTGGLSPPRTQRREPLLTFANFDGEHLDAHHQMAEGNGGGETGDVKVADHKSRSFVLAHDIDMTELSRQLAGHDPQSVRRIASSDIPKQGLTQGDDDENGIIVPARHSSKRSKENGLSQMHAMSPSDVDMANGIDANNRSRFPIILEDDDDLDRFEDDTDREIINHSAHYQASSHFRPETSSSTPPPIRNNRSARPSRALMYDDFAEDDGDATTTDDSDDQGHSRAARRQPVTGTTTTNEYHDGRSKPPTTSRNNGSGAENTRHTRLRSLSSDSIQPPRPATRTPSVRVRGSPMSGVHGPHANGNSSNSTPQSRTATLITNYRDARTPKLNSLQMYADAGPSRPLPEAARGAAPPRGGGDLLPQPHQRQARSNRSFENGMHNTGYSAGVSSGGGASSSGGGGGGQDWPHRSMAHRRTYSDDEISVRQMSISGRSATSQQSSAALPEFFSSSIFNVVLHNPTTAHQLLKFSETRLCSENVEFLAKVDEYRTTLNNLASQMAGIHKTFISPGSQSQINVNGNLLRQTHKEMKTLINDAFPAMDTVFTDLQGHIETVVFQDIYPSFVRHQMALSATRALGSDRFKYQGLGDCFTLTDPNIADNPILFASDGFVKVTGYTRTEIIPRNCRFLQGAHTDRQPVKRLKQAIEARKESVELLLNYKKNGEPFWNLLYVAPLYDAKGQIRFFIGGQVNCSTTIHTNVDVMKVLSLSKKEDREENDSLETPSVVKQSPMKPSARRALLKAFGVRLEDQPVLPQTGDGGMEDGVLNRMEGQDLSSQMKEFYTAYSKYLVVRATTWNIEFYSDGIVETLNPANLASGMVAGSEVFRFLGQQMLSKQTEYKTRVRNAIRAGMPTSTQLRLQTKRSAMFRGDESFLAHWTPLKDAKANVQWIVVTIAPTNF